MSAAQLKNEPQTREPQNYTTRVWQTRDGLPQETVQAVAQTPDGFLWIGTTGGLLRFDGSHFEVFDRENSPAFRENSVFSLTTGRDGSLWVGTEGGGLIRMQDGAFRRYGLAEGLTDGFVRCMLEDESGQIWVGTDDGLFRFAAPRTGQVTRIDGTGSLPKIAVHAIAETHDGTVWVGGSRLIAIHAGHVTTYPLIGEYSETRVKSILQTKDGTVWVGTVSGLQRLTPGATQFVRFAGVQGTVRTLKETSDGTLWIGTIGQGAYTFRDQTLQAVDSGQADQLKLPSKTTLSVFEDAEKDVWLGTQAGLVRFSRSPVELVPLPNASDSDFETVASDRDGSLWVASTHLSHVINGVARVTEFPALHGARVRNVFRAQDDSLWVGTDGRGLFHLAQGQEAQQFTTANGLVNDFVRGVLQARDGAVWVATDEGVSVLSHGIIKNYTVQEGLVYFSVRAMLEDDHGDLWIGTDRGLSHLAGEHFSSDAATRALSGEKVWALHAAADGTLWVGTRDHGIYRYVPGRDAVQHLSVEQGLASDSVYQILEDGRGRFWVSGANGVVVVSVAGLNRLAENLHTYLSQRFFPVSTGGELTPLYGGTMPSGTMTPDGDAWFPTSKGPVRFIAGEAEGGAVPRVFLGQVLADGRTVPAQTERVELTASNRNLEIPYGAILLGPQDAVQFQYKLDRFDSDWRFGSNRRVADYTNLPAGHYTFRVRAFQGASGQTTERTLPIVKSQYFYRTWWFIGGCGAALALIIWWFHLQRLRQVKLAYTAVIDERARLAREMHDTLIQGCAGVSLLLEAASADGQTGNHNGNSGLLDYARTQLAASMDEARQAVWNLRGQEPLDFAATLNRLTERLDRSSNVEVHCTVEGEIYNFSAGAMHEITMVSREAIFNALMHASPKRIQVAAVFGEHEFALTVVDDGSGFELAQQREGHYGLMGIEERVRRLGGSVQLKTAIRQGTSVAIRLQRARISAAGHPKNEQQQLQETAP